LNGRDAGMDRLIDLGLAMLGILSLCSVAVVIIVGLAAAIWGKEEIICRLRPVETGSLDPAVGAPDEPRTLCERMQEQRKYMVSEEFLLDTVTVYKWLRQLEISDGTFTSIDIAKIIRDQHDFAKALLNYDVDERVQIKHAGRMTLQAHSIKKTA
jgi:hypothetical protein